MPCPDLGNVILVILQSAQTEGWAASEERKSQPRPLLKREQNAIRSWKKEGVCVSYPAPSWTCTGSWGWLISNAWVNMARQERMCLSIGAAQDGSRWTPLMLRRGGERKQDYKGGMKGLLLCSFPPTIQMWEFGLDVFPKIRDWLWKIS